MDDSSDKLIVALDMNTFDDAKCLVESLGSMVTIYKVGSQLFTACGPQIVEYLNQNDKKVFLDLKYHDIPNTVANAIQSVVALNVFMCTVHIDGGEDMLKAAVQAVEDISQSNNLIKSKIIGITILTSQPKQDNILKLVLQKAHVAQDCGLDGVVCSVGEAKDIRREFGDDFIIVTPGIRLQASQGDDQKRSASPKEAIENGSDFLVVGRPIVKAQSPLGAAKNILKEIQS